MTKLTKKQADRLINIIKAINNQELSYIDIGHGKQELGYITNFSDYFEVDENDMEDFKQFLVNTDLDELQEPTLTVSLPNEHLDEYSEDEVICLVDLVTKFDTKFYAIIERTF